MGVMHVRYKFVAGVRIRVGRVGSDVWSEPDV